MFYLYVIYLYIFYLYVCLFICYVFFLYIRGQISGFLEPVGSGLGLESVARKVQRPLVIYIK